MRGFFSLFKKKNFIKSLYYYLWELLELVKEIMEKDYQKIIRCQYFQQNNS